jgi:hypothetical protein
MPMTFESRRKEEKIFLRRRKEEMKLTASFYGILKEGVITMPAKFKSK